MQIPDMQLKKVKYLFKETFTVYPFNYVGLKLYFADY